MTDRPAIRTLLSMACDGVGPSETCVNILNGVHRAGYPSELFVMRRRIARQQVRIRSAAVGPFAYLPYRWTAGPAQSLIEERFCRRIDQNDIAYLWPNVSLATHKRLYERGVRIVLEGINTRMKTARKILEAAYAELGVSAAHRISDARIAEEEEKYRYADAIFAPNRHVEAALAGSPLEGRAIPASYGVDTTRASAPRRYDPKPGPLTFMFCGYACVRKGMHLLLDAFRAMDGGHRLLIVGKVEPLIAERYGDLLASDRVELAGFVSDVHPYFARSDVFVFPSLEEGGPQVTYEAALHGLPIIASPMGSSRMGDVPGRMLIVDPHDHDAFRDALNQMAGSAELRESLGRTARAAVDEFDWNRVGARRAKDLLDRFAPDT